MNNLVSRVKAKINHITLRVLRWVGTHASYCAITILGVVLVGIFYYPVQKAISQFKNPGDIFIAAGGMIGTILALVFSLSIIPIQRAVDTFGPSIAELYRKDRVTQFIFIILAAFCLLSLIMAIDGAFFGLQGSTLLPAEIVVIAITLDLLRWHYRRVSQLLESGEVISRLSRNIRRYIDQTQRTVSRLARIQWRALSAEEKVIPSQEKFESALYALRTDHYADLNRWTSELAEIAYKAVGRSETHTAELAISAMTEVACHYLCCRKNNLILTLTENPMVFGSDVHEVLIPVYEHLKDINRNAVALKAETTCTHVVKALGVIARHTANLKALAFRGNSAPITWMPLGYLKGCVETAQRNGLDDVALEGSKVLLGVAQSTPNNVRSGDVHLLAIEGWYNISLAFLTAGKGPLANEVLRDMMTLSHNLLKQKQFQFVEIFQDILEKLKVLAPLTIANEKTFGLPSAPYDLTEPLSIGYLVNQAVSLIEQEEGREWVNPYGQFMKLNESICRHFRNLADNADNMGLGSSFLLWRITQTIKYIAGVYLKVLEKHITDDIRHNEELVQQVPWYLAFFWVVFSKATKINHYYAEEACDALAWVGMSFYVAGYRNVAEDSADNIASIANSYCKITRNSYDVADLLIFIWHIRLMAEAKNDMALVNKLDEKIAKPQALPDKQ